MSTDVGTAVRGRGWNWANGVANDGVSDLGFLFYVYLLGTDGCDDGTDPTTCNPPRTPIGLTRFGPFSGLAAELACTQQRTWWTSAENGGDAFTLDYCNGTQAPVPKTTSVGRRVWPISDGDALPATHQVTYGWTSTVSGDDTASTGHKAVLLDSDNVNITDLTLTKGAASGLTLHVLDRGTLGATGNLTVNPGTGLNTSGPNAVTSVTGNNANIQGALVVESGGNMTIDLADGGGGNFTFAPTTTVVARGAGASLALANDATSNLDITFRGIWEILAGASNSFVDGSVGNIFMDTNYDVRVSGDGTQSTFDFGNATTVNFGGSFQVLDGATNSFVGSATDEIFMPMDWRYTVSGPNTSSTWDVTVNNQATFDGIWTITDGANSYVDGSIDDILIPMDWRYTVFGANTQATFELAGTTATLGGIWNVSGGANSFVDTSVGEILFPKKQRHHQRHRREQRRELHA